MNYKNMCFDHFPDYFSSGLGFCGDATPQQFFKLSEEECYSQFSGSYFGLVVK